jgi:hypothetical protein
MDHTNISPRVAKALEVYENLSTKDKEFWGSSDILLEINSYLDILPAIKTMATTSSNRIDTIVDLGCSFGSQSYIFREMGLRYIGIDNSDISFIYDEKDENVHMIKCDVEDIDWDMLKETYHLGIHTTLVLALYLPAFKIDSVGYRPNLVNLIMSKFSKFIIL